MFMFFDPFIKYVEKTGAFVALVKLFDPIIDAFGQAGFLIGGGLVGIFGISGAAVAQVTLMDSMFRPIFESFGTIPLALYLTTLFIGSQITSFAYPGADMMGEMGLARSSHIKSIMINGFVVTGVMIFYLVVRTLLNI